MKGTRRTWRQAWWCAVALATLSGCGPAEGVVVQELPPLERPSIEARSGLAEVQGGWNLAGWVVPSEVAAAEIPSETFITIDIRQQRVDSLSGLLTGLDASRPFVGEIRRDGIIALVVPLEEAAGGVMAGVVQRDTLWLELSTVPRLPVPPGVRAAFVQAAVGQTWVRLPTGALLRDTLVAPLAGPDTLTPAPAQAPAAAVPAPESPRPAPAPRVTAPRQAQPEPDTAPTRQPEDVPAIIDTISPLPEPVRPVPEPVTPIPDPAALLLPETLPSRAPIEPQVIE